MKKLILICWVFIGCNQINGDSALNDLKKPIIVVSYTGDGWYRTVKLRDADGVYLTIDDHTVGSLNVGDTL